MDKATQVYYDILKDVVTHKPADLEKKWKDEKYNKYLDKFRDNIYFWKLKDKEWVSYRKGIWDKIIRREQLANSDYVKSYWETKGRFFLRAKPRKSDSELYNYQIITYTPFDNVDDIVAQYLKESVSLRRNLHDNLLTYADIAYKAAPEEFYRVKLIAEALYNRDYIAKEEPLGEGKRNTFVVTYPSNFITRYTSETCRYIQCANEAYLNKQHNKRKQITGKERSFTEVTIEYFLGCLEYCISAITKENLAFDAIEKIRKMCSLIESYQPEIDCKNRHLFIENARTLILENKNIKKLLTTVD